MSLIRWKSLDKESTAEPQDAQLSQLFFMVTDAFPVEPEYKQHNLTVHIFLWKACTNFKQ